MPFKSWDSYSRFQKSVVGESRYIQSDEATDFLQAIITSGKERVRLIPKGTQLWRAQLGHDLRPEHVGEELMDYFPTAYKPERMKPLRDSAREGRANPKGIPFLYTATGKETAMAEVRPWIGSIISAGQFITVKELKLIDFSVEQGDEQYFFFHEPTEEEKVRAVWSHINNAFSRPVLESDTTADYAPTQIIAEFIKSKGYDGIVYKSAFVIPPF
ncbi:RES family NAD+ phosphorylase [Pseudidiomarina donghaiensis]|uniref:RES domain-containing protein n=1 Tax=Pseudidiomarina donghaiensis TaxID=519452 RepID=A0A432XB42_9GAMM|nr:RES family NAD+ phosphorylase [Pseudidiomarina donghaiensis]RUO45870.1 RES domain-containing protein [Pseudidiomarina donghaiensis]SFV25114.1 RES domain-containing protein [Pseudidiomarina donghaiensis]